MLCSLRKTSGKFGWSGEAAHEENEPVMGSKDFRY